MNCVEEVGIFAGPIVSWDKENLWFKVDLARAKPLWLTDSTEILPEGTIGSANRAYLHQRLDELLDRFVGGQNG